MTTLPLKPHWDIFCTVVDNYGDIGVTWRLAKQLANEYHLNIKLWVDDLQSFKFILPELDVSESIQRFQNVTIVKWNTPLTTAWEAGEVVIEAFACELPPEITALTNVLRPFPKWINLEYLSAENWIDDCHGLSSPVKNGVSKRFFFPGFSEKSGGLICEQQLFSQRDAWQLADDHRLEYFNQLGLTGIHAAHRVISLFSYESKAIAALCQQLANEARTSHLLVPNGRALSSVAEFLQVPAIDVQRTTQGNLVIHKLPMQTQEQYDKLLWSCDVNIVRGEDSFLRAQWAAKPFIWHIYPQEEDAHIDKLQAFMERYCQQMPANTADAWQQVNLAFNHCDANAFNEAWQSLNNSWPILKQHAKVWQKTAINSSDLANRLVQMLKNG